MKDEIASILRERFFFESIRGERDWNIPDTTRDVIRGDSRGFALLVATALVGSYSGVVRAVLTGRMRFWLVKGSDGITDHIALVYRGMVICHETKEWRPKHTFRRILPIFPLKPK